MPDEPDLSRIMLEDIAQRCAHQSTLFFAHRPHDPRYCFELLRRAIQQHDQRAWEMVYAQYQPLVVSWIERHPAFASSGEEPLFFVNRAFEKMWLALTPARFAHFADLKAVLRYLQMCVHSAILDCVRATEDGALQADIEDVAERADAGPSVEDEALQQTERQELWRYVQRLLHNEQERRVIYGSFVLALKPGQLCSLDPDTFRDVSEVYLVKQNVLARLRRDAGLRAFVATDD